VHDVDTRIVGIDAAVAQVHNGLFHAGGGARGERVALRDLGGQRVPVKRVACAALGPTIKPCLWVIAKLTFTLRRR
jgi:hypothetical protein